MIFTLTFTLKTRNITLSFFMKVPTLILISIQFTVIAGGGAESHWYVVWLMSVVKHRHSQTTETCQLRHEAGRLHGRPDLTGLSAQTKCRNVSGEGEISQSVLTKNNHLEAKNNISLWLNSHWFNFLSGRLIQSS